jgi:hypothetical protein
MMQRDNLAQKPELFSSKIGQLNRQTVHVAARARQTADQAGADRIPRRRENNGNDRLYARALGVEEGA